jgi:hypothetical protein
MLPPPLPFPFYSPLLRSFSPFGFLFFLGKCSPTKVVTSPCPLYILVPSTVLCCLSPPWPLLFAGYLFVFFVLNKKFILLDMSSFVSMTLFVTF